MAKILVTGGAGYIGSHMALMLAELGHEVVVFDSLVTGYRDAVLNAELIVADLADYQALSDCFACHKFDAVMHFASFIQIQESIQDPAKYYRNNVADGLNLLDVMNKFDVKRLIFSSSAAIYGQPQTIPIDVNHLKNPLNPYGRSKLFFEEILRDYDQVYGLKSVSLRYFNAAGADLLGRVGERHNPETHLIPLLLQVASGKYKNIKVFGDDYSTKDGTCIRDYIHVVDLCKAHVLALGALLDGQQISKFYNLGSGEGCSVLEVINSVRKVTGKDVGIINAPRRPGDPTVLVADATIAKQELNWHPKYSDLATIVKHAWQWENR